MRWRGRAVVVLGVATVLALACGGGGASPEDGEGSSDGSPTSSAGSTAVDGDGSSSADGSTGAEPGWEVVLDAGEDVGAFFSVWGPSAAHVYAVGGQQGEGGLSIGALYVRAGDAWTPADLPPDTAKLNWIHGSETTRVVVGENGTILVRDGDEGEWTVHGCATVLPLWGVWVTAPDDAWAVGGDGFDRDPVLCRWDGASWSQVELPAITVDSKGLFKVFGLAADDVWAVGDAALLLHWDGSAWTQVELDTQADLISLWGTGPTELLAVGGRANGVLVRYDGAAWSVTTLPDYSGLNGVWMAADGAARIGGVQGTIATVAPGATMPAREETGTPRTIHALWQDETGRTYAVGGSIDLPPPFVGVILERAPE